MAKPPKNNARRATRNADIPRHFFSKWLPETRPTRTKPCQHPGCEGVGEYRAPARHYREEVQAGPLNVIDEKKRDASRWFCLDHVKEYNAQWDYYEGLDEREIEQAIRFDGVWNRPTWPFGQWGPKKGRQPKPERKFYKDNEREAPDQDSPDPSAAQLLEAGRAALLELGLEPPVDFGHIKKRYHDLVKQHHPDMKTLGEAEADSDTIKRLNAAFTLLKGLYQRHKS